MKDDKIMSLRACKYSDLAKNVKVFNIDAMEYHLWIYLDPEDVRGAYFNEAKEIGENSECKTIYPDTFVRESTCWIRVNIGYLNSNIGKHIIKLSFVDKMTDTDFSLYVSYYITNDNPDQPYV